jgi:hypothetical protein
VPKDSALESELRRFLGEQADFVAKLLDDPDSGVAQLARDWMEEWKERSSQGWLEVENLSQAEKDEWAVSYLERLREDFAELVEKIKALPSH